jgi:hypothetical protein
MNQRAWVSSLVATLGLVGAVSAQAASMCVFDLVGTAGDAYNFAKDYVLAMQRENVSIDMKAYLDEARAVEDYKAGRCDSLWATGLRTRPFNAVAGAIDTLGSTTIVRNGAIDINASYEVLRKLVQTFGAESVQSQTLMVQGKHEVGGIAPIGAAYLITRDRRIDSIEAMKGRRVAAMAYDPAQAQMIRRVDALPVPTDVTTVVPTLRDGRTDVIALPALAFRPLRVEEAMGGKGAVARFPLMILTYQLVLDRGKFPEGFGQKSRIWWLSQYDRALQLIRRAETVDIPASAWLELSPDAMYRYTLMLQEARIDMARQGIYDQRGLRIIKRVRCHVNPGDNECRTRAEIDW